MKRRQAAIVAMKLLVGGLIVLALIAALVTMAGAYTVLALRGDTRFIVPAVITSPAVALIAYWVFRQFVPAVVWLYHEARAD